MRVPIPNTRILKCEQLETISLIAPLVISSIWAPVWGALVVVFVWVCRFDELNLSFRNDEGILPLYCHCIDFRSPFQGFFEGCPYGFKRSELRVCSGRLDSIPLNQVAAGSSAPNEKCLTTWPAPHGQMCVQGSPKTLSESAWTGRATFPSTNTDP